MPRVNFNSTFEITTRARNKKKQPVSGATATVSIDAPDGSAVLEDEAMTELTTGVFHYVGVPGLLSEPDKKYLAKITVEKGDSRGYSEIELETEVDAT